MASMVPGESQRRVFVVEDEALIAMELLDRIEEFGYVACGHAASGEQALRNVGAATPDAVLMDIHLGPGIDGIETARQLVAAHDVPVVFLTAYCDSTLIARAADVNSFGYLLKPFSHRALKAALAIALARHDATRHLRDLNSALSAEAERHAALNGIVPVCMECQKIRDGHRGWLRFEAFFAAHSHAQFSHGYCPECAVRAFAEAGVERPPAERT